MKRRDFYKEYYKVTDRVYADYMILTSGDVRTAWEFTDGGILYVNPGSVSIPKNGSANSYMLLEENVLTWKSLDGALYHREQL